MKHSANANSLLAVIAIPLAIQQWTPVPIGSQRLPKVNANSAEWSIETAGNAGGFAYLLEKPFRNLEQPISVSWEWRVSTFPRTTPKIPFDKESDDYALRIGALLSDSEEGIRVPRRIEDLLNEKKLKLSYVVFYCTVPSLPPGPTCAISPYNDHFVNCLVEAGDKFKVVSRTPVEDAIKHFKLPENERKLLKLVGLWAFADSDNSHSSSSAGLRALQVSGEP